jgi:hypothetical protein
MARGKVAPHATAGGTRRARGRLVLICVMLRGRPARYLRRDLPECRSGGSVSSPSGRHAHQPGQAQQPRGRHPPTGHLQPVARKQPVPQLARDLAWLASLPRPDPAFKDRDAFGCFTAWLGLPRPGAILEGPGADPPSPWLGSAPEATPGTRTRTCGRSGDAASRGSGEAPRLATSPRTVWPAGRYGWRVRRRPGRSCAGDSHTTWPRASPGATRSGVALGPVPSRPSSSTLAPWKGRVCWVVPGTRNR